MPTLDNQRPRQNAVPPNPSGENDKSIVSANLFGDADLVLIHHQEEIYRLRRTRNNKLILTK